MDAEREDYDDRLPPPRFRIQGPHDYLLIMAVAIALLPVIVALLSWAVPH